MREGEMSGGEMSWIRRSRLIRRWIGEHCVAVVEFAQDQRHDQLNSVGRQRAMNATYLMEHGEVRCNGSIHVCVLILRSAST
jgi:hypothetical protein